MLDLHQIPYVKAVQHPREFMINFPGAYHAGEDLDLDPPDRSTSQGHTTQVKRNSRGWDACGRHRVGGFSRGRAAAAAF